MISLRQVEIVVILDAINLMVRKIMKLSEASRSLPGHASIILVIYSSHSYHKIFIHHLK